MASFTCLTSLVPELGDGKSCRVVPRHFLMHSYCTASEASAGSFSWVGFFWHLLQTIVYGMDTSGSTAGEPLWLVG